MRLCALQAFLQQRGLCEARLCVCVCPAWPGTPVSLLPLLSPDVAQPLSGLSECPASSTSSGEMKASHSYAVGVGEASSSLGAWSYQKLELRAKSLWAG